IELVGRLQKAQDHLHQLFEEVRGYAAPLSLKRQRANLGIILREAWSQFAHLRNGREARLREEVGTVDLDSAVDPYQIERLFNNMLDNSLCACADPVEIDVNWSRSDIAGRPAVQISLRDNGPGLSPEQKKRIFEPFYTTKTKGTGLGMAISKRIVE